MESPYPLLLSLHETSGAVSGIAWHKLSAHLRNRLERFQRRAFKVILRKPLFEPSDHDEVLQTLQQPPLESRRQYQSAILGFQLANKTASQHLLNECFPPARSARCLRQRSHFQLPTPHKTLYQSSPIYFAAHTFNEIPKHLQSIKNLSEFKRRAQQKHSVIILSLLKPSKSFLVTSLI